MNEEQLFPSDLVPLCQFDTRVNHTTDPYGVDDKGLVKGMHTKKLTRV